MPKCFNGKDIYQKQLDQRLTVPCGKCGACKRKVQMQWASRIMQETATHSTKGHCEFITLTYRPEDVPLTEDNVPTLRKADVQSWFNVQRNTLGPFRFYACGEYGEMLGRPHVHMALFCTDPTYAERFANAWSEKYGFSQRLQLIPERCAYLAKYTVKGMHKPESSKLKPGQEPEFRISSRRPALGSDYSELIADAYRTTKGQRLLAKKGDVDRTFHTLGGFFPLSTYTLTKIRQQLEIPVKHTDRCKSNQNYSTQFPIQEAEICPTTHIAQERNLNAQARRRKNQRRSL
ncbi:replication initiator protein [Microviridae sp.]|nr:replication initiator protein [Microviridae sp.]